MLSLGRFSLRQLATIFASLVIIYLIWSLLKNHDEELWYLAEALCETPDSIMKDIQELAIRSHFVLNELNVIHFVCFGSLWGAIRLGKTLPWDNNVDLCTVDEHMNKVDQEKLYAAFDLQAITIKYDSKEGHYELRYGSAVGYITVFTRYYTDMERTGWGRRFLPILYKNMHNFPSRLIAEPLSMLKFHNVDFPVPHEDFELQKYLYKEDWWKEVKPKGC